MITRRRLHSLGGLIATSALSFAPFLAAAGDTPSKGTKALYAMRGETVWVRHCIMCHGVDGRAQTEEAKKVSPPPKDLTDPLNVTWVFREDWLRRRIAEGVPGTAMPGWEGVLTPPELTAVTQFVQRLSGADRMTEQQARTARLQRGRKIFLERCAVCHGETGAADTRVATAVVPPPRKLSDPAFAATFYRDRVERVVRDGKPGTIMPAWKYVLDEQEVRAVASFVRREIMKKDD